MRTILYACLLLWLSACAGSKNYLERSDEDRALVDAVKKLNKAPDDENAAAALPVLYSNIKANHLAKIRDLRNDKDISRWDKLIKEYGYLQDAYDAIINSPAAFKLVTPESYSSNIYETKQEAAEDFYQAGIRYLSKTGRDNYKKAYNNFKKTEKYAEGYKDVDSRIKEAYDKAFVLVQINPVQDNAYFASSGWGNPGLNFSNDYFQQTLVRELNGINTNRYPARFYSDWQARRDDIRPDWVIDLILRNIDIPYPSNYNYTRNASAQVQIGTDTSGNPVYRTVTALLRVTRSSFTARAAMDVVITAVATGDNISNRSFSDEYRWQTERATYSGDSRALSARDWELINNSGVFGAPRKEDILNELFKKIYPQVKNNIIYAVDW